MTVGSTAIVPCNGGGDRLGWLNEVLAAAPVSPGYDLSVEVNGSVYICKSTATADPPTNGSAATAVLYVTVLEPGRQSQARTRIIADSEDTLAKAASGGQAAAMRLFAMRKLRIEGDMRQLNVLKDELAPYMATLERLATTAASAGGGIANGAVGLGARRSASWVPDESAPRCSEATCGKTFNPPFVRRHHCRACGGVFCFRCAPRPLGSSRESRICNGCKYTSGRSPNVALAANSVPANVLDCDVATVADGTAEFSAAAALSAAFPGAPGSGGAGGAGDAGAKSWLVDWHVEKELQDLRFYSRCLLFIIIFASVFPIVFWYWPSIVALPDKIYDLTRIWKGALLAMLLVCAMVRKMVWRLARVTWVCVILVISLARTHSKAKGSTDRGSKAVWEMAHHVHARFLLDATTELSGFYVKVAQSLSISTAVPEPIHVELAKLQDSMPADPHEDVERTLAEELGKNWREKVRLHPGPPLGSATIAQVHRATLFLPGPGGIMKEVEGVIKVQHRQMQGNLTVDMHAASILASAMSAVSPALFEDMASVVKEVASFTKNELDFRTEAESQTRARDTAMAEGVDVVIPQVFPKLVTRRVMAMEFIDGQRIDDFARGAGPAERDRVVHGLIDFFAFSFTQAGIFNCDPHPGNLLVTKDARLCVLDWGQARVLSRAEMEAFSMLFLAASTEDPFLLVEAGSRIGQTYPEHTATSMVMALRFFMRDSRPVHMSKEDMVNLEAMFTRFQQFDELQKVNGDAKQLLQGPLLPLSKTLDLLHNVSARMGAGLSLLQVFTSRAYPLILRSTAASPGGSAPSIRTAAVGFALDSPSPPLDAAPGPVTSELDGCLRKLLLASHGRGEMLGAQVVVMDASTGATISDFSIGHCSYLRARPLSRSTPFNVAEISKLHLALAVLRLIDAGEVRLNATLGELWPSLLSGKPASKGDPAPGAAVGKVTLEQVLSHTSGVMETLPAGVPSFSKLCDLQWILKHFSTAAGAVEPALEPGTKQQYQHMMYGWLLAGALQGSGRLSACLTEVESLGLAMNRRRVWQEWKEADVAELTKEINSSSVEDMAELFGEVWSFLDTCEKAKSKSATEDEKADAKAFMSVQGLVHWLHPGALRGEPSLAPEGEGGGGMLPGTMAYSTARRLAQLIFEVSKGQHVGPDTMREALRPRRQPGQIQSQLNAGLKRFREAEWGLGVEIVPLPGANVANGAAERKAWGHSSSGGSFAFHIPGPRPVVAAVLLNRLDGWERGISQSLLNAVVDYAAGSS